MDEKDIADRRRLFGTNGIRGVIGKEITTPFAVDMGMAIGSFFRGTMMIGMDSRTSNVMVKNAVISGLLSAGCEVIDVGMVPTPAVQYSIAKSDAVAGVMITASHNPPQFNGIKVIDSDGTELHFAKELEIEKIYFSKHFTNPDWQSIGGFHLDDGANLRYSEGIKNRVDIESIRKAALMVVIDCANGPGCLVTPGLFSDMGIDVIAINDQPDGRFPGHPSEPTPENLSQLMEKVIDTGASFGLAHDGDADRTIFVDDRGEYILGDKSFALLAGYIASKHPNSIVVSTIATGDCVSDMVARNGGTTVQTMVGSPVVARKMMEINAIFGGEENGGLIFADHQFCRDGSMTAALMAELVAVKGSLSEQIKEVPVYHQVKLKIECSNKSKKQVLSILADSLVGKKIDLTDGIKVFDGRDWVLIRPSGTESIFRIFSQSRSEAKAHDLAKEYYGRLEEIISQTG